MGTNAAGTCYVGLTRSKSGNLYYLTDKVLEAQPFDSTTDTQCLSNAEVQALL